MKSNKLNEKCKHSQNKYKYLKEKFQIIHLCFYLCVCVCEIEPTIVYNSRLKTKRKQMIKMKRERKEKKKNYDIEFCRKNDVLKMAYKQMRQQGTNITNDVHDTNQYISLQILG